jgi:hypothetical protein
MFTKMLNVFSGITIVAILALSLMALVPAGAVAAAAAERPGGYGQGTGTTAPGAGYVVTPLSAAEKEALSRAVLEEYGALNLYQSE